MKYDADIFQLLDNQSEVRHTFPAFYHWKLYRHIENTYLLFKGLLFIFFDFLNNFP